MKALKKVRDFLQIVLGALWLFFPSLIFLVLITFILATMTIGRDLVQMGIEDVFRFLLMPISFSVWAYISWYSSR